MGRSIMLMALCLGLVATASANADEPATYRVMSFNIRNSGARDGANAWPKRRELFVQTIREFNPDLFGMQEVLPDQAAYMKEQMSDYGYVGVGRDDGKNKGEASPVMYKKSRFDVLDSGQFWLSETPEVPGSKGWDAALTRICSWVRLKDKTAGVTLMYLNSHWDHIGVKARTESGRLMRKMATKMQGNLPAIITGDFNSTEDSPAYKAMVEPEAGMITLIDSYREVHPQRQEDEASFHGFKATREGSRIDFILHTPDFVAKMSEINHTQKDGHYPSDHYAVQAVLVLKK